VDSITDLVEATAGELDVKHLGRAFLAFLQTGTVPQPARPPSFAAAPSMQRRPA
jgi:hypothetical protein